jgi:hypothetical protein
MSEQESRSDEVRAAEFPLLREFFRGYLHQDMREEHGSVESAAANFWENADIDERVAIAKEWERLLTRFKSKPFPELIQAVTRDLGSGQMLEPDDVEKISALFNTR